jgi:hypothetical protein
MNGDSFARRRAEQGRATPRPSQHLKLLLNKQTKNSSYLHRGQSSGTFKLAE